mgnify:FL=1
MSKLLAIYAVNSDTQSHYNDDTGTQPAYGLKANSSIIFTNSTQPSGSTSNTLKLNGAQIY